MKTLKLTPTQNTLNHIIPIIPIILVITTTINCRATWVDRQTTYQNNLVTNTPNIKVGQTYTQIQKLIGNPLKTQTINKIGTHYQKTPWYQATWQYPYQSIYFIILFDNNHIAQKVLKSRTGEEKLLPQTTSPYH